MTEPATDQPASSPDKGPLARLGILVRTRLAANPQVERVRAGKAELFLLAEFMSGEECAAMCAMIDEVAQPSKAYTNATGGANRTSYSGDVERRDPFVQRIERRIDELLGLPNEYGETIQGQRYRVGQEFGTHRDWFRPDAPYWEEERQRGGRRSWTAMVYLNEVEQGGATEFPGLGIAIEPTRGMLLTWNNATPAGLPNGWTVHAGLPVIAGVKYVITKWYRTRRWGVSNPG